ncbi:MAG: cyclic nucleotide-binding domain-containing protein [Bdellovibrionota bacterium]
MRKIKRGEILFSEGDTSRAMYLVKSGMIRLYKKKGDQRIELDTVRSGQVLGELAFLDGNPRSASGEALTDCELMEISGPTFEDILKRIPDWLKILLKTIVGRLRTASTRIRQLESSAVEYDKEGKRTGYVFVAMHEVLKILGCILLGAARYGKSKNSRVIFPASALQRFASQIYNIPVAKITTLTELLTDMDIMGGADDGSVNELIVEDIDFLDKLITYLNEQNLLEPSKRKEITSKGLHCIGLIVKYLSKFPVDEKGIARINVGQIRMSEGGAAAKGGFRIEDLSELVRLGYITNPEIKTQEEAYVTGFADQLNNQYRFHLFIKAIEDLNQKKRTR